MILLAMGMPIELAFCPPFYLSVQLGGCLCQRIDQKQAASQQEESFETEERSQQGTYSINWLRGDYTYEYQDLGGLVLLDSGFFGGSYQGQLLMHSCSY